MKCPNCSERIGYVDAYSTDRLKAVLKGNKVIDYKHCEPEWMNGEIQFACPVCGADITSYIEG